MGTAISQCSFGLTPATAVDALAASLIADGYPFSHHRCFNTDDEEVKSLLLTSPEAPHLYRC